MPEVLTSKQLQKISTTLSFWLRHKPDQVPGLTVDSQGWANLTMICPQYIGEEVLRRIVAEDEKGRYELRETTQGTLIRCVQGHSLPHVKIAFKRPLSFPAKLYHGTSEQAAKAIRKSGLKAMTRNHVHLTDNYDTAKTVGLRHAKSIDKLVIFEVFNCDTIEGLHKAPNGVWLAPIVTKNHLKELHEYFSPV